MSDLFHEAIPLDFVQDVFRVMQDADWHTFQVLTKRPEYALQIADQLPWPENVWLGVSVETPKLEAANWGALQRFVPRPQKRHDASRLR
jgi:protein gp37